MVTTTRKSFLKKIFGRSKRVKKFQEFGYEVNQFTLSCGTVEYAGWLHPSESKKTLDDETLAIYQQFIKPGDVVIDIGAHTGDTSVPMALCAGPTGVTFALEPNPYVYKVLAKNASLNPDITHIIPLNFAATDQDGEFTFHYSDAAFCNGGYLSSIKNQKHGHHYPLTVQGVNLEAYLTERYPDTLDRITFIKVDTEGFDHQVLNSLKSLIIRNQPVIVAEMLKKLTFDERARFFEFLSELNYELRYFDWKDTSGPILNKDNLMAWKHYDFLAYPRQ